jgi:hypothetical protein
MRPVRGGPHALRSSSRAPASARGPLHRAGLLLLFLAGVALLSCPCCAQQTQADVALRDFLFRDYSPLDTPPGGKTTVQVPPASTRHA